MDSYPKAARSAILRSAFLACAAFMILSFALVVASPAFAQPEGIDPQAVLNHLNAAIGWYRNLANMDASAGSPSDVLYLQNARDQGLQVLRLAFQSAREEALLMRQESPSSSAAPPQSSDQQNIAKAQANATSRIEQTESAIDALNERIKTARGKNRQDLTNKRDALQGELDLDKAIQQGLSKIADFMENNENTGLLGKINALQASVPELAQTSPEKPPAHETAPSNRVYGAGLIGQASLLLRQIGDVRTIDGLLSHTTTLRTVVERLQTPLRNDLRGLLKQGRDVVNQPQGQTGDARQTVQTIISQFKQVSSAALPLRQEMILLDQVRANLVEWRKSVETEYGAVLRSLLTHVGFIIAALLLVMLFSEVWRRATYRYVREARRRRQVLLLRRFATGFFMAVVIILGFVSEFQSLATFAGFLTAGIAVALQTVILSLAAYFFLIGRYGVRVGDRITISGVTGEVIDIGLVRLHLLELAGTGVNLYPTGRVVVFSNSVLLQASPLFKQIPGTSYTWHEAVVPLSPSGDRTLAEKKFLDAVSNVYETYGSEIEKEHAAVERIIEAEAPPPTPQGRLSFTEAGVEFVARYPVEIRRGPEIDDQIVGKLLETIEAEPALKAAVSGPPRVRSVIKG